jgi:malate synthase
MLPKVTITEQVTTHVRLFEIIEKKNNLAAGTLNMETMIEATQIIMDEEGKINR